MKHKSLGLLLLFTVLVVAQILINPVPAQSPATLSLDPSQYSATAVGETFTVSIKISNAQNVWGWVAALTWNPDYISPVGTPSEGDFLKKAGSTLFVSAPALGWYYPEISCFVMLDRGASGEGTLATLTFKVLKPCIQSPITLVNTTLISPDIDPKTGQGYTIPHTISPSITRVSLIVGATLIANAGEDQTVAEGTVVTFNGSKTYTGNEAVTYTWSFFDGTLKALNGTVVSYIFEIPGVYNVTLTVENAKGEKSEAKIKITVKDITPPVPMILVNNQEPGPAVPVGQRVKFSGINSYDPEGGKIIEYRWKFGADAKSLDVNATHIFNTAGIYDVSLTVFDLRGNNSATKTIKVSVGTPSSPDSGQSTQPFTLPPLAILILTALTIATLTGSVFWLRKMTPEN